MAKRKVFYSFHFNNDVMRVQLIRNMGVIEGNTPVTANAWEEVKRKGDKAIKDWIDDNMEGKSCVIVLIGAETYNRPWVNYEIKKAWEDGRGLLGIHIHNLNCPNNGTCAKGIDPLSLFEFKIGNKLVKPKTYNPKSDDTYNDIKNNIDQWIEDAIALRG